MFLKCFEVSEGRTAMFVDPKSYSLFSGWLGSSVHLLRVLWTNKVEGVLKENT